MSRLAQVIEDAEWIVGTDSPENIARRLGYANPKSLAKVLNRAGRNDLARAFWHAERSAA